ncbi:hypothetical protein AMTR_s00214p00017470 [Amborella trichopoda]|uniref:Myb/SANT-like domain-containing protein n=1 Tax=Amborella trichopoda TaxID=13333 RepID=W1P3I4_AMBTC|nr:hypothetical protein AMTR_s00214p00017470 [Amborella trichopoda]
MDSHGLNIPTPAISASRAESSRRASQWSPTERDTFIDLMVKEHRSKQKAFQTLYGNVKRLILVSGFGWVDKRKMVTAEATVWDDYITENDWAKMYRNKSLPDITRLELIFHNGVADGTRSSVDPVDLVEDSSLDDIVDGTNSSESWMRRSHTPIYRIRTRQPTATKLMPGAMGVMAENMREIVSTEKEISINKKEKCMEYIEQMYELGTIDADDIIKVCHLFQSASIEGMFYVLKLWFRKRFFKEEIVKLRVGIYW